MLCPFAMCTTYMHIPLGGPQYTIRGTATEDVSHAYRVSTAIVACRQLTAHPRLLARRFAKSLFNYVEEEHAKMHLRAAESHPPGGRCCLGWSHCPPYLFSS